MSKRRRKKNREHLDQFFIAGFSYYEGAIAFKELEVGTVLALELDENNPYDARAVMLWYNDFHLGYIPRENNRIFYKLLRVGAGEHIEVRVQRIDPSSGSERQIKVIAHLAKVK